MYASETLSVEVMEAVQAGEKLLDLDHHLWRKAARNIKKRESTVICMRTSPAARPSNKLICAHLVLGI